MMATDTPGSTAPVGSVTVPRTVAVTPPCANAVEPEEIRKRLDRRAAPTLESEWKAGDILSLRAERQQKRRARNSGGAQHTDCQVLCQRRKSKDWWLKLSTGRATGRASRRDQSRRNGRV